MPLRIAAKIPRGERVYFKKQLEPHIDGRAVQLVGEVDEAKKQPFLAGAAALLFPIDWPEPFGLVMIEASAPVSRNASPRNEWRERTNARTAD
jgi:glycosyltransferase involved in cell wall biosynthesis